MRHTIVVGDVSVTIRAKDLPCRGAVTFNRAEIVESKGKLELRLTVTGTENSANWGSTYICFFTLKGKHTLTWPLDP